ncbi:MAG: hypothetical protein KDE07_00955 [Sphingomonadaceae bacterium]|nr:hypothetical protein [Sphingomonadaceae bacterium]
MAARWGEGMVEAVHEEQSRSGTDILSKLRQSRIARLLLAVLAIQAAYWLVFYPNFVRYRSPERPEFIEVTSVELASIATPDAAAIEEAKWQPYANELKTFDKGYYATRTTFDLAEVPPHGIAVLDMASGDNIWYVVNGKLHSSAGSMEQGKFTYHGLQKRITQVSPAFLKPGTNTIDSIIGIELAREATLQGPQLAEYKATERAFGWTDFLFNDFRNAMIAVTLAIALMVGVAALRARDRSTPFWLFLLALSWGMHALFYRWVDLPIHGAERGFLYAAILFVMSASWPCFVDAWSGRPVRWFKPVMLAICALAIGYAGYWLLVDRGIDAFTHTEWAMDRFGLFFVSATVGRIVWHFITVHDDKRYWEAAILVLLASLMGYFLFNTLVYERNIGVLPSSQPLLLLAIVVAFFSRNFTLFKSQADLARTLQDKLDLREAELATAHEREKRFVREQAFDEERQRIMRDMHDGLGSQLMSMLLAARRGKVEPDRMAEGLQTVIDEMRLMIDSMDSVGESLGSAMASFRNRLQPRIEDAGFAFHWENRIDRPFPSYPPRKTLQLFRIMQEAVTNALKHSQGSAITVLLDNCSDRPDWLCVAIRDDGSGIRQDGRGGHGLENMRVRAKAIGAEIEYGSHDNGGGEVRVAIPPTADAQPGSAG